MKIKDFPIEIGIFQREIWKISDQNIFQRKIGTFQREIWSYLRIVSSRVIVKFLSVKRLDGCIQGQRKISSSKFKASWKRLNVSDTDGLRYNCYLLLCMDNNLDHSFERKFLSTGRKLQLFEFFHFLKALEDCK